jgi:pSer/pThr/pTyr-binding forkhead associated (FHA) protein
MARLAIKTDGLGLKQLELKLGLNRIGRDPECDFRLNHPTISTYHCELILSADGVVLRDCDSTNGTFVNGHPVDEVWLEAGQQVRFGDVELVVESTETVIAIPKIEREVVAPPPVVLENGSMLCPRHPDYLANFRCPVCQEIMCSGCVRIIRLKGGKPHFLCVKCHNPCERITVEQTKKKKGFLGFLQDTVHLRFSPPRIRRD